MPSFIVEVRSLYLCREKKKTSLGNFSIKLLLSLAVIGITLCIGSGENWRTWTCLSLLGLWITSLSFLVLHPNKLYQWGKTWHFYINCKEALAGGGFLWRAGAGNGAVSLTGNSAPGKASSASSQANHQSSPEGSGPVPLERDQPLLAPTPAGSGWQQPPVCQGSPWGTQPREKEGKQLTGNCKTQISERGLGEEKNLARFCKKSINFLACGPDFRHWMYLEINYFLYEQTFKHQVFGVFFWFFFSVFLVFVFF